MVKTDPIPPSVNSSPLAPKKIRSNTKPGVLGAFVFLLEAWDYTPIIQLYCEYFPLQSH